MPKKPFSETKFGKFVERAKPVLGDVLQVVGDVTGIEAVERVGEIINERKNESEAAKQLYYDFERYKMDWQLEILKIENETLKLEYEEMANVRQREIEHMKVTGKRDWMHGTVVICALVCYIGAFLFLAYGPSVNPDKKDLLNMAIGQVFTFAGMAFSYYLGTTRSSKMKDQIIYKQT